MEHPFFYVYLSLVAQTAFPIVFLKMQSQIELLKMKSVFIISFMLLFSQLGNAQSKQKEFIFPDYEFSILGGPQMSFMNTDGRMQGGKPLYTYHFGLGFRNVLKDSSRFVLSADFVFSRQGYNQQIGRQSIRVNLNYLNVPATIGYRFSNIFYPEIGFKLGLRLSGRISTLPSSGIVRRTYSGFDNGFVFGLNFFEQKEISLRLRYTHGMYDIVEGVQVDKFGNKEDYLSFNTRLLQLAVKIKLN